MTGFEWFLLIVVVIAVPLIVAVVVTLWTLEQARLRNRKNRGGDRGEPVKRMAVRWGNDASPVPREPTPENDVSPGVAER